MKLKLSKIQAQALIDGLEASRAGMQRQWINETSKHFATKGELAIAIRKLDALDAVGKEIARLNADLVTIRDRRSQELCSQIADKVVKEWPQLRTVASAELWGLIIEWPPDPEDVMAG